MPASLRKACHACTAAKRRCIPRLPQCSRCADRGLRCTYDLEPVTNIESDASRFAGLPSAWQPLPRVIFDSVASAHQAVVQSFTSHGDINLPVMANPETLALVTEHYLKPIPQLAFQQKPTPYVHGQVLLAGSRISANLVHLEVDTHSLPSSFFLDQMQWQLVSLDIQPLSFTEFLATFHQLIAVLLALILNVDDRSRRSTIPTILLDLWPNWRQHFYSTLPRTLSGDLSAWQAWCTAESARRTLLCVILVDGMLEVVQKGYCSYRPMVESLPFDARTGLWEANTEQEWLAAVAAHGGTQSSLISWSEFIESGGSRPRKNYDGVLQRILLVIHFGKVAV